MGRFIAQGNALIWRGNGETLHITPWGENSLRVRASISRPVEDTDYALLAPKEMDARIEIGEKEAVISNGRITAKVTQYGWRGEARICFYRDGAQVLSEIGESGALALKPRSFRPITGGDHSLTVAFESGQGEKLYGMGQYQQEILDIKNCAFELAHRNSQASVPFLLSSLGYGFLWHNPAVGRAVFGKNRTEWFAESTRQMDYWITVGDTPSQIVEQYMEATGKPPMMPEYGMGFWQCKLRYWNQEQLLAVAREYRRRELPLDVIVCDFFHWPRMGDYRFDEEFFPDPKAMASELKGMGIELAVSVWPQVALTSENFSEMKDNNLLVRTERGVNVQMQFVEDSVFFDATNPEARAYVWDKCRSNYYDAGVRVFWLDEAEPEYGVYDFDNYRYSIGSNVQVGNLYPQYFSRGFYEGMLQQGQEGILNLVRCAWAGSQRYGALVWSGDVQSTFEDFRKQICAGLQMGIAGIPWWTTDIGGFHGGDAAKPGFVELLIRWFQFAAFCPVMRLHGDRQPTVPVFRKDGARTLSTGSDNEVWSFGDKAYKIMAKYMRLREAMRPYVRDVMRAAHERGTPAMRAMFYEFPGDSLCWELTDQYMFGPDILVAPIVHEGAARREVYLPAGCMWTDANTGESHTGGRTVCVDAPIEIIPVFLRDGKQSQYWSSAN